MTFAVSTANREPNMSAGDMVPLSMGITKIWKGDIVLCKADGYAYSAYATGATGDKFMGVAAETVDNTGGSAGDETINVYTTGVF